MTTEINTTRSVPLAETAPAVAKSRSVQTVDIKTVQRAAEAVAEAEKQEASKPAPVPVTREQVDQVTRQIQDFAQKVQRDLAFTVEEGLNTTVITVTDAKTKEVIRQIPSEEVLELARTLQDISGEPSELIGKLFQVSV